jgi:hypothetical protein
MANALAYSTAPLTAMVKGDYVSASLPIFSFVSEKKK